MLHSISSVGRVFTDAWIETENVDKKKKGKARHMNASRAFFIGENN